MSTTPQTATPPDDLDAVRKIVEALAPFARGDQERILRWAVEKLGVSLSNLPTQQAQHAPPPSGQTAGTASTIGHGSQTATSNIREFVAAKSPKSDNQFAAVVAYYFRFEAPPGQRKEFITSDDLQEACRQAGRERLKNPNGTLNNAHSGGLLDRGKPGDFTVNAVGENLVAMTLPAAPGNDRKKPVRKKGTKPGKQPRSSARAKKTV
jgi:hypothetical protein